jgi:hypothetical protein
MEEFVIINEISYRVEDWLDDSRVTESDYPSIVASVFEDNEKVHVIVRSPLFEYELMTLDQFIQYVTTGVFTYVPKPMYRVGQTLFNRFTEESIDIKDIPSSPNDVENEYVYFVREYTSTFGHNFKVKKESEITSFYQTVGVEEI